MQFLCAQGDDVSLPEAQEGQARSRSELSSLLQLLLRDVSTCKQLPGSCDFGCCITAVESPDSVGLNQLQRGCL